MKPTTTNKCPNVPLQPTTISQNTKITCLAVPEPATKQPRDMLYILHTLYMVIIIMYNVYNI